LQRGQNMPIVFVHGVNVRKDDRYKRRVQTRDAYLQQYVAPAVVSRSARMQVFNPYWGEWGAKLAWNHASLPQLGQESFGAEDELLATLLGERIAELADQPEVAMLTLARESLRDTVDLIFAQALQAARERQLESVVALAAKANNYAEQNPAPAWLSQVHDDQAFYIELSKAVDAWTPATASTSDGTELVVVETFGTADDAWNVVRTGYRNVRQGISRLAGQAISAVRTPVHKVVSIFLGDIFKYIQDRGTQSQPGPIVQTVVSDLEQASMLRSSRDPLIVIAHSMGGNICYDIFSYFRPEIEVDAWITVGSQVSLFEELKLFQKKHPGIPIDPRVDRVSKPSKVAHWLNIYDTNDVLSFACEGVFTGVVDYEYLSGVTLVAAHTMYIQRTSFYQRLAYRLRRLLA